MALTKAQWDRLQARLPKEDRESYKDYLAANPQPSKPKPQPQAPVAPTSGIIPNFTPEVTFPTPATNPGEPGFVGPVATTDPALTGPLGGLGAGVVAGVTGGTTVPGGGVTTIPGGGGGTNSTNTTTNPLNTSALSTQQVDSIAAIKALLSSYGVGDLGDSVTNAVIKGYSADTIDLIMQDPNSNDPLAVAFQKRFSANKARAAQGKAVLSPAAYLGLEKQYSEVMRSYGVSSLSKQETLSSFISNDVSPSEVSDRVGLAVTRIQNADPETKRALAEYYPMLNQTDIVTSFLDPKEGLPALQRKVTMAEIGGAGLAQNIKVSSSTAEDLTNYGVTKEDARKGYSTIAEITPRSDFLSQISQGPDYGQADAEAEVFKGTASAKRARESLISIEQARFQGSSGMGKNALGNSRQGSF